MEKRAPLIANWRRLISYCRRYVVSVVLALAMAASAAVLIIAGPNKLKAMTNLIQEGLPYFVNDVPMANAIDLGKVGEIAILLLSFYLLALALRLTENLIMATVTQKIAFKLRQDISDKINKLPLKYFDRISYGDVLSRVVNDVDTVAETINQNVDTIVFSLAMLIGSTIMMFVTNWIMAVIVIASSLVGFALMGLIMAKSQKYFNRQQEELGEINGHIEEIYSGHAIVQVYNASEQTKEQFEEINHRLESSARSSQFLSGLMPPLMMFIGNFGYVAICLAGAVLAKQGDITFGVIVAFMLYVRLFTSPLSNLAQGLQGVQKASAASYRIFSFFDEAEEDQEKAKKDLLQDVQGEVIFDHVRFGYQEDKIIIGDFSAHIKAGQKVAIVGPTGAGKTTLVNLLMRYYELNGGRILIDQIDIKETKRSNVRAQFSMVLQDTWLFEGTVRDNIRYCLDNVSNQQVVDACKTAGLDHYIKTLPKGYDTVLDDQSSLSQGQRQLMTIARAIIQNAPMLILDEATSSVDTRTELLIQKAMDQLMKGRTSFIIAHRLSTIKNADLILVLNQGDIVESGTHEQLLAQHGFYYSLYQSQFEE